MLPSDEVQVTMTRSECARIHAALRALVEVHRMSESLGLESALRLTDAADVIEGVLPRLAEQFPHEDEDTQEFSHMEHLGADTKTYGTPDIEHVQNVFNPNAKVKSLAPEQAAQAFASEYDESLRALLGTLDHYTDFTHEQFHDLLNHVKELMEATIPIPQGLTLGESGPYVEVSDLLTLGGLAHEMYKRQDQIEDKVGKPF